MPLRPKGVFALGVFAGLLLAAVIVVVSSKIAFEQGLYEPCRVGQVWTVEVGCVNAIPYGPGWSDVHPADGSLHGGHDEGHEGEASQLAEMPVESPEEVLAADQQK